MSNYTYERQQSELKKDGEYEVRIEKMEVRTLPSGVEKLFLQYRIRDDIEGQAYKGACIFEDIWHEKDNPNVFNRKRINQLLGTQDVKEGTVFDSINDVINFLLGKPLIVVLVTKYDDYRGENINSVNYYRSSKQKPKTMGETTQQKSNVVDDKDLPF